MKKFLLFVFALSLLSCVDKDFDLGKVDDSGIVFGDEFIAPVGAIDLKIADFFSTATNSSVKSQITVTIPDEPVEKIVPINAGFDKGIIDQLTSSGTQSVHAVVSSSLKNVKMRITVKFDALETPVVDADLESESSTFKLDVTKEMLEKIAASKKIVISMKVLNVRTLTLSDSEVMKIDLKLYRKGGIKFN